MHVTCTLCVVTHSYVCICVCGNMHLHHTTSNDYLSICAYVCTLQELTYYVRTNICMYVRMHTPLQCD